MTEDILYPKHIQGIYYVAGWIAHSIVYRRPVLVWITEYDIWNQNWHLYYKLRQSHADHRLLDEAPGHLFLDYEAEDLTSFLQIAMLNGWGGYILTEADYINAFFSHDEWIRFYSESETEIEEARKALAPKPPL